MPDAEALGSTVVDLADALTTGGGTTASLDLFARAMVRAATCGCACVAIAADGGNGQRKHDVRLRVAAATGQEAWLAAQWESERGEGACTDAYRTGAMVRVDDLEDERRWPWFGHVARGLGHRSLLAIPLAAQDRRLGACTLFDRRSRPWTAAETSTLRAMADVVAAHLVLERQLEEARVLSSQLSHALASRIVIEQAKGMLAERHGLDVSTAFDRMRRHARSSRRSLHAVASDIVAGRIDG